jgi:hypothetical protein
MKNLLTLLLCIASVAASAQEFNWTANPSDTTGGTSDQFEIVNAAYFINSGEDSTFIWIRTSDLPTGWANTVCDVNQCYGELVDSAEFIMAEGDSFKIKSNFYPNNIDGLGCIDLQIFSLTDRTKVVSRRFCASTILSSVKIANNKALQLYPNPASSELNIEVDGSNKNNVVIVNALGQIVHSAQINGAHHSIDVANWTPGMYFVKIEAKGFVSNKSFIKL